MATSGDKYRTVSQLVKYLKVAIDTQSVNKASTFLDTAPRYAFLVGAGVSLSAGLPSTQHLATALASYEPDSPRRWEDILSDIKVGKIPPVDQRLYYELMDTKLPLPQIRHDFITSVVQFAAKYNAQINDESILLASIILASTGYGRAFAATNSGPNYLYSMFARSVFTTNFDELLPTTFYLANRPVDVVDQPRCISGAQEYPTVVYLHGRHLHYNLRNTQLELGGRPLTEHGMQHDLFHQFRNVLQNTGLIVIGYSGNEDRVTQVIRDALDNGGLPYGLYWVPFRSPDDLGEKAREIVESSPLAYYLCADESIQNNSALRVLSELVRCLGLDEESIRQYWFEEADRNIGYLQKFRKSIHDEMRIFITRATNALNEMDIARCKVLKQSWDQKLKDQIKHVEGEAAKSEALFYAGRVQMFCGKYGLASDCFKEALASIEAMQMPVEKAFILNSLGHVHNNICDMNRAIEYYNEAEELTRRLGLIQLTLSTLKGKGDCYLKLADFNQAEWSYKEAIRLSHETGIPWALSEAYRGLGHLRYWTDRFEDADKLYKASLEIAKDKQLNLDIGHGAVALARAQIEEGALESAVASLATAEEVFTAMSLDSGIADVLIGKALLNLARDDAERALDDATKAVQILETWESPCGTLDAKRVRARALLERGEKQRAQEELESLIELALSVGHQLMLQHLQRDLAKSNATS